MTLCVKINVSQDQLSQTKNGYEVYNSFVSFHGIQK